MLRQPFGNPKVEYVVGRVRVEDYDVTLVSCDVGKAFDNLIEHLDESSRCRASPLFHDEPLEGVWACGKPRTGSRLCEQ